MDRDSRHSTAQNLLNNGRIPIPVWIVDVASVAFFTNLGVLEEDFNESLDMIDASYFNMSDCLLAYEDTHSNGKGACEKTIAVIHSHIRAATNVIESAFTQEADRPDRSTSMPKVVVGVPRVLKVFSWGFIYKFHKKIGLGPKTSVKPG